MKILIIEDNPDIVANLYEYFEPQGHVLDNARTGPSGLALAFESNFDVIILDGMLPGLDGLEVCKLLRKGPNSNVPILMLTARDTTQDKVDGLYAGADDYLVKPYSLIELEARLQALHRRSSTNLDNQVKAFGDLQIDTALYSAYRNGQRLSLSPSLFKLLGVLVRAAPNVVTREVLERELWKEDPPMSDALRSHIHSLRQAVDKPFPESRPMIITVQGIGYRLADDYEKA